MALAWEGKTKASQRFLPSNIKEKMTKNTSSSDLRSELTDLVKRRIEIAVKIDTFSCYNFFKKLNLTYHFLFTLSTGYAGQFRAANLRLRRELPGGYPALWEHHPGMGQVPEQHEQVDKPHLRQEEPKVQGSREALLQILHHLHGGNVVLLPNSCLCLQRKPHSLWQAVSGIVDLNADRNERSSETESQPGVSSDENSRDPFLGLSDAVNGDKQGKVSKSRHSINKKGSKKAKLKWCDDFLFLNFFSVFSSSSSFCTSWFFKIHGILFALKRSRFFPSSFLVDRGQHLPGQQVP